MSEETCPDTSAKLPVSFTWLNITQFLGALNDNVFKLLVIFVLGRIYGVEAYPSILFTASVIFVVPFLLFSHAAGVLADRVSKSRIILITKGLEIVIMSLGCVAIGLQHPPFLYAILFLMCTQSALFGPSKYGIIPELVGQSRLSKANSFLVGLSYLAIIIGTFLPSFLTDRVWPQNYLAAGLVCVGIAVVGFLAAVGIARTPPAGSHKRFSPLFILEIFRTMKGISKDRHLFMTVLANAYFLLLGAFIQMAAIDYGTRTLGLTLEQSGYLFPVAAIGIGIGALLAGAFSGRNIEFGIVPLAAAALTLACLLVAWLPPGMTTIIPLMYFTGLSAGAFVVPLSAFVQYRSPLKQRGEILACQNFLSFLGVAVAAGIFGLLANRLQLSPRICFLVIGLLTAALTALAIRVLPDFLVRFLGMLITRTCYRIRVDGMEHVPAQGGALLVSNHVTFIDALFLQTSLIRRIRFLMIRDIYDHKWLNPLFRLMRVIPIRPHDPPHRLMASLMEARQQMDQGFIACIFAEGAITRTGHMRPFKTGLEHIVKGSEHPIIPTYIGGGWGSIFSYFRGRILGGAPRQFPYPVTILYGSPMPPTSTAREVQRAVEELALRYVELKRSPKRNLVHASVRTCRRLWRRNAIADSTGKRLTYGHTLAGAIALSRCIDAQAPGEPYVGILMPTTVAGALANMAVTLTGRTSVNLNFTASRDAVAHAIRLCEMRTLITSRTFLEKLGEMPLPENTLYIEDIAAGISRGRKLSALIAARCLPPRRLMTFARPGPDDLATLIFSSGSTGQPKGVMLTHQNILSNMESYAQVFRFEPSDNICATLPFFHSFGFTTTLWCPLVIGFSAYFHPNPLDAARIVEMIRDNRLTMLMTTPTFLTGYIRKGSVEAFQTVRALVTGAEKLKRSIADAAEKRLGIRPFEGYGTTELSPVVAVNVPDVDAGPLSQPGTKEGSVGHAIPNVLVKAVDPAHGNEVPLNTEGLLLVRGPNVMKGYFKEPEQTVDVISPDGWYNTGDIVKIDEDGFIFITDRLSRFSKIGGEMVPHIGIEEKVLEALGVVANVIAVTAVPDERKGEQLVLLFTAEAGNTAAVEQAIRASDIPNLWKPKRENLVEVDEIPKLGSGKLDLKQVREIARTWTEAR